MKILNKKAFSVIEYALLFVIIIGAFLIMRSYIQRGIFGMWGKSGQSFAFGRQYDPQRTIECSFDEQSNLWYDRNCFQSMYANAVNNQMCVSGDPVCEEGLITNNCQTNSCMEMDNASALSE